MLSLTCSITGCWNVTVSVSKDGFGHVAAGDGVGLQNFLVERLNSLYLCYK